MLGYMYRQLKGELYYFRLLSLLRRSALLRWPCCLPTLRYVCS